MGLVSRVLPDDELLDGCLEVAESMARFSPYGLAMTKDVLWANLEVSSLEAAVELEDRNQLMLGFTENLPEAIRAFDAGRDAAVHRRAAPRHVPRVGLAAVPLEDAEGAEAGRVEERVGLGDAAAGLDRLEVADGGSLAARSLGPPPPARRCRGPAASRPGSRRAPAAGSWSTGTSQVMSCSPRSLERVPAALVAAVGPQPLGPGPVRPARRWSTRSRTRPPGRRPPRASTRVAHPVAAAARPWGSAHRPAHRAAGRRSGGNHHLGQRVTLERRPAPRPTRRRSARAAEREVVEQLVGEHDARPGTRGAAPPGSPRSGRWRRRAGSSSSSGSGRAREGERRRVELEVLGVDGPLARRHLDEDVAQRRRAARGGGQDRPRQRAGPRPRFDDGEHVRLARVGPPAVERPRDHGAEQRPHLRARDEVAATARPPDRRRRSRAPGRTARASITSSNGIGPRRAIAARTSSSTGVIGAALGPREVEHDPGAAEALAALDAELTARRPAAVLAAMSRPRPVEPPRSTPRSSSGSASAMPGPPSSTASSTRPAVARAPPAAYGVPSGVWANTLPSSTSTAAATSSRGRRTGCGPGGLDAALPASGRRRRPARPRRRPAPPPPRRGRCAPPPPRAAGAERRG